MYEILSANACFQQVPATMGINLVALFHLGCLFVVLWPPPRTLMNFESSLTGAKWQARK